MLRVSICRELMGTQAAAPATQWMWWSLGCGKSSGTDERPGQQGFGTTCQGVPAVGLDRQKGVCLAVCEHECVSVMVCVCMRACALPTSLEGIELFPRQGESRLAYPPLQDPSPPHDLAHDGGQHARQHMRMCMHIHTLCP